MRPLKLIEVRSEIGAGTRGASLGPDAIRMAALDFGSSFFGDHPAVSVPDENYLLLEPPGDRYAKRIAGVLAMTERIAKEVCGALCKGEFPVIIGGDHSIAAGSLAGICLEGAGRRLGVVWIDAHSDIHSPYTTPSGNMHGMPVAASLGEDNREAGSNRPGKKAIDRWQQLKQAGGFSPKLRYSDLVMIGVRDTEPAEQYLLKKNKVRNFTVAELRRKGAVNVASETLALLEPCTHIHVSFDVDVLDPSVSRGTGTPVPNGLGIKDAGLLLGRLMQSEKVVSLEMVEVNPLLDRENRMAEHAFELLVRATSHLV